MTISWTLPQVVCREEFDEGKKYTPIVGHFDGHAYVCNAARIPQWSMSRGSLQIAKNWFRKNCKSKYVQNVVDLS